MDNREGQAHQICIFMRTDNYCIMSHSKKPLEYIRRDGGHYDLLPNAKTQNTF